MSLLQPEPTRSTRQRDGFSFFGTRGQRGWKRLFSSEYTNRAYQQAQPLPFSNGTTLDVNPQIAPDGAFLVFCSADECRATRKIISLLF
jgi:hypothetical protein